MAAATTPKFLGPWKLGVNNRLPDTDLKVPKEGSYLRSAVNVDIDNTGRVKRRRGATRIIAGTNCHSLWSHDGSDKVMFYVDGATLFKLVNGIATPIRTDLTPNRPMSFDTVGDAAITYFSNGIQTGTILNGVVGPWGLPVPSRQLSLTAASSGGTLYPGTYRFYYVHTAADGQESGSSEVASVTCSGALAPFGPGAQRNDNVPSFSIAVSGMPTAFPQGVVGVSLYMTAPGGDVFSRVATNIVSGSYTVLAAADGPTGHTLNLAPMPAGNIVRLHISRVLTAIDNFVFYSEPFTYNLHDPQRGFLQFPSPVTLIAPLESGVFICADKTYWFKGDIAEEAVNTALSYGAVRGSDVRDRIRTVAWWMTPEGIVTGNKEGQALNVQTDAVAVDAGTSGATLFRETDGLKQAISSTFGTDTDQTSARSFMSAEIIRKGTTL